mgnify:CR=1
MAIVSHLPIRRIILNHTTLPLIAPLTIHASRSFCHYSLSLLVLHVFIITHYVQGPHPMSLPVINF